MSRNKTNYYHAQILEVFKQLNIKYPNQGIGQHLSIALSEYPNYWGMSDKEFLFALEKYKFELEENTLPPEQEIEELLDKSSSIDKLREGIDYEELNDEDIEEEGEYGD